MNLLQENTQTLEKMERESAETLAARRRKIDELDTNIRGLEISWQSRQDRLSYYKGMLDSSAQQQVGGGKASSTAVQGGHGRASSFSLAGKKP